MVATKLKYCPFCGCDDVRVKHRKAKLGTSSYIECSHCAARGGSFVGDNDCDDDAAIRDWNQSDIRPETICHRVRLWFTQLEYDITSYYYKIRHWDF
jgi:Lar family restriction alleviation protein